jgi:integrase
MRGLHPRLVFPSPEERKRSGDERLSNGAMLAVINQLGYGDRTTMHGFRSSFRTWAGERGYDPDIAEACLAHKERDAMRAAYDRVRSQPVDDPTALFTAMRRQILVDWHDFVSGVKRDNVAQLQPKRKAAKRQH